VFHQGVLKAALCTLAICLSGCAGIVPSGPEVAIETGLLRGKDSDGVLSFKNIPYAAPPVGRLRWQPPQDAEPWDGVRSARSYGATCAQLDNPTNWFKFPKISEDCLTLNVWTTNLDPAAKLPVMVSIHGGGFVQGSGNIPRQDGNNLAKRGVVLVSINYRLAMFGFMTHPALAKMNPNQTQGNYGLLDSQAALEWVQRNISSFGGDPDNVTIFGTSAGGNTVNSLLIMPGAKGLFQKAIAQSASTGLAPGPYLDKVAGFSPPTDRIGEAFVKRFDLDPEDNIGEALYDLSMKDLLGAMTTMDTFTPVTDGVVIPDQVGLMFEQGLQHDVDYIMGTNSFEAALGYQVGGDNFSPKMFARLVRPEDKERLYSGLNETQVEEEIFADIVTNSGARFVADNMVKKGSTVYGYYLSYIADARRGKQPGAAHADDVAFVTGNLEAELDLKPSNIASKDREVSDLMMDYWVQFAKTGNPNGAGLPEWPAYDPATSRFLEFGDETRVLDSFLVERMDYHVNRSRDLLKRITGR